MRNCGEIRLELLDCLQDRLSNERRAAVEAHVARCASCAGELRELREVWDALPAAADPLPPVAVRTEVLAYARRPADEAGRVLGGLWRAVRGVAVPVVLGAAATVILVLVLHLRGAMAPLEHLTAVGVSLALAAVLAAIAGGLLRSAVPRPVRAVLLGSLGGLGGYLVLTLISPITDSVQICRVAIFGDAPLSMGEICLVYLAIAVLYAGLPMGLAAFAWGGADGRWRAGLVEAGVFALLAAPTAVLQLGIEEWIITLTVLVGLIAGSFAGGLAGTLLRARRSVAATR